MKRAIVELHSIVANNGEAFVNLHHWVNTFLTEQLSIGGPSWAFAHKAQQGCCSWFVNNSFILRFFFQLSLSGRLLAGLSQVVADCSQI